MNKVFYMLIISSFIFSEEKMFWDLGVIVETKSEIKQSEIIKPLVSNTKITPKYNSMNNFNILNFNSNSINQKHIIKLLYFSERYFELTEFIKQLKTTKLTDDEIFIYSDALYRLGKYKKAIKNLNLLSSKYPGDEKYFLLALYNKKSGNKNEAKRLLNKLILNYPNSEYFKLAKLQTRILKSF